MSDRTILNPEYANSLNGIFNGTGEITVADINATAIKTGTLETTESLSMSLLDTATYTLYPGSNFLVAECDNATLPSTIQLTNSVDYVNVSCPSTGILAFETLQLGVEGSQTQIYSTGPNELNLNSNVECNALTVGTAGITLKSASGANATIFASQTVQDSLGVTGDFTVGNTLTVNANVVGGILYSGISSPTYGGGMEAFSRFQDQSIAANSAGSYTITFAYSPFDGWDANSVIVVPTLVSQYNAVISGIGLTNAGSGNATLTITFYCVNAQTVYGIVGLLFYQPLSV